MLLHRVEIDAEIQFEKETALLSNQGILLILKTVTQICLSQINFTHLGAINLMVYDSLVASAFLSQPK